MHTTSLSCSNSGTPLPEPYSYCSCEVGSLGCAHLISLHFTSWFLQMCVRVWSTVRPDQDPLTPEELLSLFPPCIMRTQKIPCRSQYLVERTRHGKKRMSKTRDRIIDHIEREERESSDNDSNSDEDDRTSRDIVIPLEKILSKWTLKILHLEDSANEDRPRIVSEASEEFRGMKEDLKNYLGTFPPTPCKEYEQDFLHEMEYRAMYAGEIPKNNNWGFYLYKTAHDRHKRMIEYQTKHTGEVNMVFVNSPQQKRSKPTTKNRSKIRHGCRTNNTIKRQRDREFDRKIVKIMRTPTKKEKNV